MADYEIISGNTTRIGVILEKQTLVARNGATVSSAILNSSATLTLVSGARVVDATVNPGGAMYVCDVCSAVRIVENGGFVDLEPDVHASFVPHVISKTVLKNSATIHSGTTAVGLTLEPGSISVFSGGEASDTVIHSGGRLFVSKKGSAVRTTVDIGGSLGVGNGARATDISVNFGASMYIASGGTATGIRENGGYVQVVDGAKATFVPNTFSGAVFLSATVHSGTTANNIYLHRANLFICSGGKLTGKTVCAYGDINAENGAIVDFDLTQVQPGAAARLNDFSSIRGAPDYTITVKADQQEGVYVLAEKASNFKGTITVTDTTGATLGTLTVGETATVQDTPYSLVLSKTVLSLRIGEESVVPPPSPYTSDGLFLSNTTGIVDSGMVFHETVVLSHGILEVSSGGTAEITWVNRDTVMHISSGGAATMITENGGYVDIQEGADATFASNMFGNFTYINQSVTVHSGTTAYSNRLMDNAFLLIFSGGSAENTWVESDAEFFVSAGGFAKNTTVDSKGLSFVYGTADGNHIKSGGVMHLHGTTDDNTIEGVMHISDGATATGNHIKSGGVMLVSGGGSAHDTVVDFEGELNILAGGAADNVILNSGSVLIKQDGVVNSSLIRHGLLSVSDGGTANDVTVFSGGSLIVSDGGTATVAFNPWQGAIVSSDGASVTMLDRDSCIYYGCNASGIIRKTDTMESQSIHSGNSVIVYSGGIIDGISAGANTCLFLSSGGTAGKTLVSGGDMFVSSGGMAVETTVGINANLIVMDGGTANEVTIRDNSGKMVLSGGGTANKIIVSRGIFTVSGFGTAYDISIVKQGICSVCDGGRAESAAIQSGGSMHVFKEGTAEGIAVSSAGRLSVAQEGIATNVSLDSGGTMFVLSGGTADGVSANALGRILISSGGSLTGMQTFESGADVSALSGAVLSFDLSLATGGKAQVNGLSMIRGTPTYTLTVDDSTENGKYLLAEGAKGFNGVISVQNTLGESIGALAPENTLSVGETEYLLTLTGDSLSVTIRPATVSDVAPQTQTWEKTGDTAKYVVEYSTDNFEHVIRLTVDSDSLNFFRMPADNYQMRVKPEDGGEWAVVDTAEPVKTDDAPKLIKSDADGNADVFFINAIDKWESGYKAQHNGSISDWGGTKEHVALYGKNRISDMIEGSTDANILLMTDDTNGDALFVDDIFSTLPGSVTEQQSRFAQIDEIRAGAGDDIVDMTSHQFEYIGSGLTIRGGDGDDTIWANKGNNTLFGDAGNDRIVGASGDDVIAGGTGNDSMHGGGGDDVFTFCDNWGADTVEQADGSVTLWFVSGSEANWNAETLVYSDNGNSVIVSGVKADGITLKFGDDGSEEYAKLSALGAFDAFSSQKIFEESGNGFLAAL